MKVVRGSRLVGVYPSGDDSELFRYRTGITGVNIVRAEQAPHTVHEDLVAALHVMYVASGTVTARIDGKDVDLVPGDAIYFLPRDRRRIANNTDETAVLLLIDKGPGVPITNGPGPAPQQ